MPQQTILFAGFDAFRDHVHPQHTSQFDDGAHDLERLVAFRHSAHERAVDLEHVERKGMEVVERTVAGAEIVHEQGDAESAQGAEHLHGRANVGDEAGLGHFETELAAGDAGFEQQGLDVVGQPLAGKLTGGEVDADPQRTMARILAAPLLNLHAGFGESPVADGQDQAVLLGQRDEVHGWNQAALGVRPADQRLKADDLAGGQLHFRLVEEDELAVVQSVAQICCSRPASEDACLARLL